MNAPHPMGPPAPTPTLSVLHLNPQHPQVRADTRDVQAMHARIISILGIDIDRAKGRELWAQPRPDRLIIQYSRPVAPEWLPDGYHTACTHHPVRVSWEKGDRVRWAAVLNPLTRHNPPRVDGVRTGSGRNVLVDPREYALSRLACLDHSHVDVLDVHTATGVKAGGRRVAHRRARLAGEATVLDPDRLAEIITGGQGHAKAYGCGLVLVTSEESA